VEGAIAVLSAHPGHPVDLWDGPQVTQGLMGVKLGTRTPHLGVFFKARAGVTSSFPTAFPEPVLTDSVQPVRRLNEYALDFGGVMEFYVSHALTVRLDASDVTTIHRPQNATTNSGATVQFTEMPTDALQICLGAGWRF
jgi:hypothetical protein